MPNRHPFLDLILPNAILPQMRHGPDHSHDPHLPDAMLSEITARLGPHPALPAVAMLLAADHDCRGDRFQAAIAHLDLAETRLKLDLPSGAPALQTALGAIVGRYREHVADNARLNHIPCRSWFVFIFRSCQSSAVSAIEIGEGEPSVTGPSAIRPGACKARRACRRSGSCHWRPARA